MLVSDLGEFGLIEALCRRVPTTSPDLRLPPGDDAAVWRSPGCAVATTDTLVEDVHFRLAEITPEELGWKALAVNLSDVAAMGGAPRWALVTLGLRRDLPAEQLFGLYDGLGEACRAYGTVVAGGDVVMSPGPIFVTVALLGQPAEPSGRLLTRSAARPGDLVAVTGTLGGSAAWLHLPCRPVGDAARAAIRRAHFRPSPRVREGQLLLAAGVTCAIDVSDGLIGDLGHVCRASGVAAELDLPAIPVDPAAREALGPELALDLALAGGEDYELLVCAPAPVVALARARLAAETGTPLTVVGRVAGGAEREQPPVQLLAADGTRRTPAHIGWDHLRGDGGG
jgi:thiamine-monophosphate kinase